jgi:hypothetical protein
VQFVANSGMEASEMPRSSSGGVKVDGAGEWLLLQALLNTSANPAAIVLRT